jgi:hypothetical protein
VNSHVKRKLDKIRKMGRDGGFPQAMLRHTIRAGVALMTRMWRFRSNALELGRFPLMMGVLNTTPDSFSDGGRFDRVERKGTDVLVVDYKTGGYLPDTAGLAEDLQALVYLAAAAQRWPWAGRVTFRIDNLRHSGNVAIGYERGEIPALIGALAQRFRAAAERLHAAPWPAREGDHCRWCPFAAAYCPAKGRTPPVHAYAPGDDQPLSDAEGELSCPPRS